MRNFLKKCYYICFPAKTEKDEVVIHAYPQLIFTWPIIFLGFAFWAISGTGWIGPKAEAWIYMATIISVLLTLGVDLNRNVTIFWIISVIGFLFTALWLQDVKGVTVFHRALRWVTGLNPTYSADMGLLMSVFLSLFFVIMMAKARLNDRWRFTHNEIEHCVYGQSDNAMARGAKRVTTNYPDVLETLIAGAGTITIYSAQGNTVLATIPHVPLLPLRMKRISHILESLAVSAQTDKVEADETHGDEFCEDASEHHM